jgi:hypothetical protein
MTVSMDNFRNKILKKRLFSIPIGGIKNTARAIRNIICNKISRDFDKTKDVFLNQLFYEGNQNINRKTFSVCKKRTQPIAYVNKF